MQNNTPLNDTERNILIRALEVAAEQYVKDAATVAAEFGEGGRTHRAFTMQAESARLWAEKIENAGEVIIR